MALFYGIREKIKSGGFDIIIKSHNITNEFMKGVNDGK